MRRSDRLRDQPLVPMDRPPSYHRYRLRVGRRPRGFLNASVREQLRTSIRVVVDEPKKKKRWMKYLWINRGPEGEPGSSSEAGEYGIILGQLPMYAHAQDVPPVPSIPEPNTVNGGNRDRRGE